MQESCRKDVERAFGVLQARFAIIKGPGRFWYREDLTYIMKACIVLHNMIVEDERDDFENIDNEAPSSASPVQVSREQTHTFAQFIARHHQIRSSIAHHALRNDIVEHLWLCEGE